MNFWLSKDLFLFIQLNFASNAMLRFFSLFITCFIITGIIDFSVDKITVHRLCLVLFYLPFLGKQLVLSVEISSFIFSMLLFSTMAVSSAKIAAWLQVAPLKSGIQFAYNRHWLILIHCLMERNWDFFLFRIIVSMFYSESAWLKCRISVTAMWCFGKSLSILYSIPWCQIVEYLDYV